MANTTTPDAIVKHIIDNARASGGAKVIPDNQWPVLAQHLGFPKTLTTFVPLSGPYSGTSLIKASEAKQGDTGLTAALDVPAQGLSVGAFSSVSDAITSTLDFMKFIAWIFHPRNILRAVEFIVGITLMIFGLQAAMQARGEKIEGFSTSEGVLTRSGLGRVATELGHATRSRERPQRPRSAPHRTRQRALSQRYRREEDLQRRRSKNPRPKRKP